MRFPRLTKSIFLDQFIFMQAIGVLIGLAFPFFLVWYGLEKENILHLEFFVVSQIAGQVVGLISFLLIATVIRPHLKLLSSKMQDIAQGLEDKTFSADVAKCNEHLCQIDVVSNDEIGVSSKAYNQMLSALMQAHEVERVYNQFSKLMSETLETEALADRAINLLIESTHVEGAAVLLLNSGELKVVSSQGLVEAKSLETHDMVLSALKKSTPLHLEFPDHVNIDGVLTHFKPSEVFVEPIEFKKAQLGVLIAATGAYVSDERTEQLIQLFSRSIGLAFNNTMIHSKFQKLAAVDGLTNIYNRRFGMDRLKEDFSRAQREQSHLSVAMVDIDHFKSINDTYGHLVGDKAIIMIANIIKKSLRDGDIVIRYGGEEFMMLLHGATCEDAHEACERIRHQVKDTVLTEGDQKINLTASIGVVSYPHQKADNEVALIDMADQCLYHAKQTGRNKVVTFEQLHAS